MNDIGVGLFQPILRDVMATSRAVYDTYSNRIDDVCDDGMGIDPGVAGRPERGTRARITLPVA